MQTKLYTFTYEHEVCDSSRTPVTAHFNQIGIWNLYAPPGMLHIVMRGLSEHPMDFRISTLADGCQLPDLNTVLMRGDTEEWTCVAFRQAFISIRYKKTDEVRWSDPMVLYWVVGSFDSTHDEEG